MVVDTMRPMRAIATAKQYCEPQLSGCGSLLIGLLLRGPPRASVSALWTPVSSGTSAENPINPNRLANTSGVPANRLFSIKFLVQTGANMI